MTPRSFQFDTLEEFAEFTPLDFVRVKSQARFADLVQEATERLSLSLAAKREAIIEDFLVSGAMPWDIRIQEGPPKIESVHFTTVDRYRLTAWQHFRIV